MKKIRRPILYISPATKVLGKGSKYYVIQFSVTLRSSISIFFFLAFIVPFDAVPIFQAIHVCISIRSCSEIPEHGVQHPPRETFFIVWGCL